MPLPKIEHPTFEVQLNSIDHPLKFRPFLVKEEKLLLMAKEANELEDIMKTMKQVLKNCCLEDLDVDSLPLFDIEMAFIHLRINSVGETVQMTLTCDNVVEGNTCSHVNEFDLQLKNIKYDIPAGHSKNVKISKDVGVVLKYPTLKFDKTIFTNSDDNVELFVNFIDYVYDEQEVYKASETPKQELVEFLENLTLEQIKQIKTFFLTSPSVVLNQDLNCAKCGHLHHVNVEGVLNFFD